jgi:hypothetical protein
VKVVAVFHNPNSDLDYRWDGVLPAKEIAISLLFAVIGF